MIKKTTLEEAAEGIYGTDKSKDVEYYAFINGAKWQQERMYSEEEVLNILQEFKRYLSFGDEISQLEWFEQFKNK